MNPMLSRIPTRWRIFAAAPHRMLFFGGAFALVVSMLWWGAVLLARAGLPGLGWFSLPPVWLHAWMMVYGVFPFFVLGFLMTAFVRWIGAPPIAPGLYQPVAAALFAGFVLVVLGALTSPALTALGMSLTALAWLAGALGLGWRLRRYGANSSPHPPWALVLLVIGWLGAALSAWGCATGHWAALAAGPKLGLWGFLAPMLFVVAHRMLPFFAQANLAGYRAFRPGWAPALAAVLFLLHAALEITDQRAWLVLPDAPLAALSGWLLWRWQPWRARANPLLWSLFASFFWLPVALALSAAQSLIFLLSGHRVLGLAPLHVLAIGVLTGMVVAMVTRVSLGHSGRALTMDKLSLACFLGLQLAVITRLLAEWPGIAAGAPTWLVASAGLWLLAITPWALHHIRIYWQPRIDGQPG